MVSHFLASRSAVGEGPYLLRVSKAEKGLRVANNLVIAANIFGGLRLSR